MSFRAWVALAAALLALPSIAVADDVKAGRRHAANGDAAYKAGDFEKALSEFEEAYRALNAPELFFHIGNCQRALKKPDEALKSYTQYLEQVPDAGNARAVKKIIQELKAQGATGSEESKPGAEAAGEKTPAPKAVTSPAAVPPPSGASPAKSEDRPAKAAERPAEASDPFLPSLAVVGVFAPEKEDADGAAKLGGLLADMAGWSGHFGDVVRADAAAKTLGAQYASAANCGSDAACYEPLGRALGVDRLVVGALNREGISYQFHVVLYDTGLRSTDTVDVESISLNVEEIQVLLPDQYNGLLERASSRRGKLTVTSNVPDARVKVSGVDVGAVPVTRYFAAGTYTVRVEKPGYEPFEDEVVLNPAESHGVEAALKKGSGSASGVAKSGGGGVPAIFMHPGLYTAVGGAAVVGVGLYFGATAKGLEAKGAPDANGVRGITPVQAAAARTDALLANIFVIAGVVVIAGSGAWIFVMPPASKPGMVPSGREPTTVSFGYSGVF